MGRHWARMNDAVRPNDDGRTEVSTGLTVSHFSATDEQCN